MGNHPGPNLRRAGGALLFVLGAVFAAPMSPAQIRNFPHEESFDAGAVLPPEWLSTRARHPPEDDAVISGISPRSAPHCVLFTNATVGQALTSPAFMLPGHAAATVTFHTRRSSSFGATVLLEVSVDSGRTFQTVATQRPSGSTSYVPVAATLDSLPGAAGLGGTAGGTGQEIPVVLRWRILPDSSGTSGTFRLDDVSLTVDCGTSRGHVVINEIMFAPAGDEPEWIEVTNTGSEPVSLAGWSVADAAVSSKHPLGGARTLSPLGGCLVLCKDSASLAAVRTVPQGSVVQVPGFPSLNNTGDVVVLFDELGRVADSVSYLPAWGSVPGVSLERIDPFVKGTGAANWGSSADLSGATPGLPNSIRRLDRDLSAGRFEVRGDPGAGPLLLALTVVNRGRQVPGPFQVRFTDLHEPGSLLPLGEITVFQEIAPGDSTDVQWPWPDPPPGPHRIVASVEWEDDEREANGRSEVSLWIPYARSPLCISEILSSPFAGDPEYIEVANISGLRVDLKEWSICGRQLAGESDTLFLDGGAFMILTSDSGIYRRYPWLAGRMVLIAGVSLGLNNDGDTVVLRTPEGSVADSLLYEPSWHNPLIGDPAGRSLEKILLHGSSTDRKNWSTCLHAAGGTPCAPNSLEIAAVSFRPGLAASPNPFSPDADGHEDFSVLRFELPADVCAVTVTIFDIRGRTIRHLASGQPVPAKGEMVWDGLDDRGRPLPIGPYIAFLEGSDREGTGRCAAKCLIVVARRL